MAVVLKAAKPSVSAKHSARQGRIGAAVLLSFLAGCGGSTIDNYRGVDSDEGSGQGGCDKNCDQPPNLCEKLGALTPSKYFPVYRGGEVTIDADFILEVMNAEMITDEKHVSGRVVLRAMDSDTRNLPEGIASSLGEGKGFWVRDDSGAHSAELETYPPGTLRVQACDVREEADGIVAEIAVDRPIDGTAFCTPNEALYDEIPRPPPGTNTSGDLVFDLGDGFQLRMYYLGWKDATYRFTFSVSSLWTEERVLSHDESAILHISFMDGAGKARDYTVKVHIGNQGSYSMPVSVHRCD